MMTRRILPVILISILFCTLLHAQGSRTYKIIVNRINALDTISKVKLSQVFLKKVKSWDGGDTIYPVDLMEESSIRETFSLKIHKRSIKKIKSYWKRQIFTKKSVPPPQIQSYEDVLAFVASDPGAIGYVSGSTPIQGYAVKVITVEN